jgi:hypothetical protein
MTNAEQTPFPNPESLIHWQSVEVKPESRRLVRNALDICEWWGRDWLARPSSPLRRILLQKQHNRATFLIPPLQKTDTPLRINYPTYPYLCWIEVCFPPEEEQIGVRYLAPDFFGLRGSAQSLLRPEFLARAFDRLHRLVTNPRTKVQVQQCYGRSSEWESIDNRRETTIRKVLLFYQQRVASVSLSPPTH